MKNRSPDRRGSLLPGYQDTPTTRLLTLLVERSTEAPFRGFLKFLGDQRAFDTSLYRGFQEESPLSWPEVLSCNPGHTGMIVVAMGTLAEAIARHGTKAVIVYGAGTSGFLLTQSLARRRISVKHYVDGDKVLLANVENGITLARALKLRKIPFAVASLGSYGKIRAIVEEEASRQAVAKEIVDLGGVLVDNGVFQLPEWDIACAGHPQIRERFDWAEALLSKSLKRRAFHAGAYLLRHFVATVFLDKKIAKPRAPVLTYPLQ